MRSRDNKNYFLLSLTACNWFIKHYQITFFIKPLIAFYYDFFCHFESLCTPLAGEYPSMHWEEYWSLPDFSHTAQKSFFLCCHSSWCINFMLNNGTNNGRLHGRKRKSGSMLLPQLRRSQRKSLVGLFEEVLWALTIQISQRPSVTALQLSPHTSLSLSLFLFNSSLQLIQIV